MQIQLFTIPVLCLTDQNEELNKFLRNNKILELEKHLLQLTSGAYWCYHITYTDEGKKDFYPKEKIDYKETLTDEEFQRFSKLRETRKKIAIEDAVSAFVIFSNAELSEIAKLKSPDVNNIRSVKGVGDKKAEKYGERLLNGLIDQ